MHSPGISQNLIQNKCTFDETLACHGVVIFKNSPKKDVSLKVNTSVRDLGHLSAGYLLADDIDPQHDCTNNYPRLFFETNAVSLSVLYGLQDFCMPHVCYMNKYIYSGGGGGGRIIHPLLCHCICLLILVEKSAIKDSD